MAEHHIKLMRYNLSMFRNWIAKQSTLKLYVYAFALFILGYALIPLARVLLITHWPCSSIECSGRGTMETSLYYAAILVSLLGFASIVIATAIAIRRRIKK